MVEVRKRASELVGVLGCDAADRLPMAEPTALRSALEVRSRCLALFGCVAVAFGLDRPTAQSWLQSERLELALTASDEKFVTGESDKRSPEYRAMIESLWALAWVLSVVNDLKWDELCTDDFVRQFPDPRRPRGSMSPIVRADRIRGRDEIAVQLDAAYMLHHCHVEAARNETEPPGGVPMYAVVHRRRALEWVTSDVDWDEITLDT